MCKSAGEGGQRCPSAARKSLRVADGRLAQAQEAYGKSAASAESQERLSEAMTGWENAASVYASTEEGESNLLAQAKQAGADGDLDTEMLLGSVVRRGQSIRAANAHMAALSRAAAGVRATVAREDAEDETEQAEKDRADQAARDAERAARKKESAAAGGPVLPTAAVLGYRDRTWGGHDARKAQAELDRLGKVLSDPNATEKALVGALQARSGSRYSHEYQDPSAEWRERVSGQVAGRFLDHPNADRDLVDRAVAGSYGPTAQADALAHAKCPPEYIAAVGGRGMAHRGGNMAESGNRGLDYAIANREIKVTPEIMQTARVHAQAGNPDCAVALAFTDDEDRVGARRVLAGIPVEQMHEKDRAALAAEMSRPDRDKGAPVIKQKKNKYGEITQRAGVGTTWVAHDKILDERLSEQLLDFANLELAPEQRQEIAGPMREHPKRSIRRRAKDIWDR